MTSYPDSLSQENNLINLTNAKLLLYVTCLECELWNTIVASLGYLLYLLQVAAFMQSKD